MKLKNIKCKNCGCNELLAIQKTMSVIGIYCKKCRKWIKWADKEEKKLCYICETCTLYNSLGCPYCGSGVNYGICDEYKAVE